MKHLNSSVIQSKINQSMLLKALIYEELKSVSLSNDNANRLVSLARRFVFVSERLHYFQLSQLEVHL